MDSIVERQRAIVTSKFEARTTTTGPPFTIPSCRTSEPIMTWCH